jgi:hypothetical protein
VKPLSPRNRVIAQAALDWLLDEVTNGTPADAILSGLIETHGAVHRRRPDSSYELRCGGIATNTTTGNQSGVLIAGWRRNAVVRLSIFL